MTSTRVWTRLGGRVSPRLLGILGLHGIGGMVMLCVAMLGSAALALLAVLARGGRLPRVWAVLEPAGRVRPVVPAVLRVDAGPPPVWTLDDLEQENQLMRHLRPTTLTRRPAVLLGSLTLGLALTLTACGNEAPASDTSAQVSETDHNDADIAFATDMIQHHAQALSMVDLTVDRTLDPEVQQLADDIREAQGPEIETMSDWLQDWNEEVPQTMRDHASAGHDMEGMGDSLEGMDSAMPGMMSAEDFDELENAPDSEFQTMWLEMMIAHHQGAVEMAQDQQDNGQYKAAVDLAGDVVDTQTVEIDTMNTLLGS